MKLPDKTLAAMGEAPCPHHRVPTVECGGPHPAPSPTGPCLMSSDGEHEWEEFKGDWPERTLRTFCGWCGVNQ